jgi:THO complex subunit 1
MQLIFIQGTEVDADDGHVQKHLKQKHLIVLRCCNELLRRLSRAEDTVFCGRVYIFLFQVISFGDRSSVNLRGEYHLENTTSFEEPKPTMKDESVEETMEDDAEEKTETQSSAPNADATKGASAPSVTVTEEDSKTAKTVTFDPKDASQKPMDMDTLYPIFWSLQHDFCNPLRLFDAENLRNFKNGLGATMAKFQEVQKEQADRGSIQVSDDKKGVKRKRGESEDDRVNGFNPKYLTSRDLFELEVCIRIFRGVQVKPRTYVEAYRSATFHSVGMYLCRH